MEPTAEKDSSDIWYSNYFEKIKERFLSLLKDRTDFEKYSFAPDIDHDPSLYEVIFKILNLLGVVFPDVDRIMVLKCSISKDFIMWLKEARPDILNFMIKNTSLNFLFTPKEEIQKACNQLKNEGNNLFSEGKYEQAIEKYNTALLTKNLENEIICVLRSNIANSFFELYKRTLNEKHLHQALLNASESVKWNPKWMKGYYRIAQTLQIKGDDEGALYNYEICLELNPDNSDVKNKIAHLRLKLYDINRDSILFANSLPKSEDEHISETFDQMKIREGNNFSASNLTYLIDYAKKIIPGYADVLEGHKFRDGNINTKIDYEQAAKHYAKAIQKNNPEAAYNLALLYSSGKGVKIDFELSITFLKIAAESDPFIKVGPHQMPSVGVAEAQHTLGLRFWEGIGVAKDKGTGLKYFEQAFTNGSGNAANDLGVYYSIGNFVEKDLSKAEELLLFAISKNVSQAAPNLVDLYLQLRDPDRALLWHDRAIKNNCLFSKTRDSYTRNSISLIVNEFNNSEVPEWEQSNNLEIKHYSIKERRERYEKNFQIGVAQQSKPLFNLSQERISIAIAHREIIKAHKDIQSNKSINLSNVITPPQKNTIFEKNACHAASYKKIFLKDIEPTRDYVLNKYYLQVINIDLPLVPYQEKLATFLRIQDENKTLHRLAIYNLGSDRNWISEKFAFGVEIKIYSPYHRLSGDGLPMIRIDNPATIEILKYNPTMCRTCGRGESKKKCSKCRTALYCSKECHMNDWKQMKHSLICIE